MKKIIGLSVAVLAIVLLGVKVLAATVPATVTVPSTCGMTASGGPLTFGSVPIGTESSVDTITVDNTGNIALDPDVEGTNWGPTFMSVTQTSFKGSLEVTWNNLTIATQKLFTSSIVKGASKIAEFKVAIPSDQDADSYSQTITITETC